MIELIKIRTFYEAEGESAIILNYLFAYPLSMKDYKLKTSISEKNILNAIEFFIDKQIDYTIISEKTVTKTFKNNHYEVVLTRAKKELPVAFEIIEKLNSIVYDIEGLNSHKPNFEEIKFVEIQNLINSELKQNFENIIKNYKSSVHNDFVIDIVKPEVKEEKPVDPNAIKLGSKITLIREDTDEFEDFIMVAGDDFFESDTVKPLSITSELGRLLLGKTEWDFVERGNTSYQIISVKNEE